MREGRRSNEMREILHWFAGSGDREKKGKPDFLFVRELLCIFIICF